MQKRYSEEFKESVVKQMMPPSLKTVPQLVKETGVSDVSLYKWRKDYRNRGIAVPGDSKNSTYWSAEDKLAQLQQATNRLNEAEPLMRRALAIDEASFGPEHPNVARDLNNLAELLRTTSRLDEAEPLVHRALAIDEASYGPEHPDVARDLDNLARLLQDTNRLAKAEPLSRRILEILLLFTMRTGHEHHHLNAALGNYKGLLAAMGHSEAESEAQIEKLIESARTRS